MPIVKLYIAATLDGYIARPDGNLDWLTSLPYPENGKDYGYQELLTGISTIIMGRTTYEELLGMGIEWPYADYKTYVATRDSQYKVKTEMTFAVGGNMKELVAELKRTEEKDIWLVGGGKVISEFLNHDLIDRMIITIVPKNLGDGIRLFPDKTKEVDWKLVDVEKFNTGLVNLTYNRV